QVSAFYAKLASVVTGGSGRRLVLTTENILAHPQLASRMRPNLLGENAEARLVAAMLDVGIDRKSLEHIPGVVLCPTRFIQPVNSLPDCAPDLVQNDAFDLWRRPLNPSA